ncbi:MAG: hypothetical protein DWQ31_00365 [Planctomycetota bacterium]|nr:MAG: hypothetical protein DWQ31_00365 [Planctomycetota bacterium]
MRLMRAREDRLSRRRGQCRCAAPRWFALACLIALVASPRSASAEAWNSFEGPLPSWQVLGGDVPYRVTRHERVDAPVHSGSWSEHLVVEAGGGSQLHAAHDIPPVALIAESEIGLWLRCDRPGMQLIARVVLPRSIDPTTGRPATLILYGSLYQTPGRWSRLQLTDLPALLERQVRLARSEQRNRAATQQFDTRQAYIDQIRLNIYGGQGTTRVWIDDLEIGGYVEVPQAARLASTPAGPQRPANEGRGYGKSAAPGRSVPLPRITPVAWQTTVLAAEGKPLLPRIIEHRGEPFAFLRELGFNAAALDQPPTIAEMKEATAAGMWLVCPAPRLATKQLDVPLDPILAWHAGSRLSRLDLRRTAESIAHVRRLDSATRRPICGHVTSNVEAFSRHLDVVLLDQPVVGTQRRTEDYFQWLMANAKSARPGTTFWTTIHDQPPAAYRQQAEVLGVAEPDSSFAEWSNLRALTLGSIAHGARGLLFASAARLDAEEGPTRRRAAQLELLNHELSLVEPWAAGGQFVTTVQSSDPTVVAHVLQSDHTRLVVPVRIAPRAATPTSMAGAPQALATSSDRLRLVIPGVPAASKAYQLLTAGIEPLASARVAGGKSISLPRGAESSLIVFTSDPLVISRLKKQTTRIQARASELTRAVAASVAHDTDVSLRASGRVPMSAVSRPLEAARQHLDESRTQVEQADFAGSVQSAHAALAALHAARHSAYPHFALAGRRHPLPGGPTPFVSLPAVESFALLPALSLLGTQLAAAPWSGNRLAGGDCENLTHMVQAGWRHVEFPLPDLRTEVQLSPRAPHGGRNSLLLRAAVDGDAAPPALIETPPVWVESAPVPVTAGQRVKIQGVVRVAGVPNSQQSATVLLVFDSIGGQDLALRVESADVWQPFVLYRGVPSDGQVMVTFALEGAGEAWVDDVTIETAAASADAAADPSLRFPGDQRPGSGGWAPPKTRRLPPFAGPPQAQREAAAGRERRWLADPFSRTPAR